MGAVFRVFFKVLKYEVLESYLSQKQGLKWSRC
jgi:hypothetical protein